MKTLFALALGLLVGAGPAAAQPAASLRPQKAPSVLGYSGRLELQRKGSSAVEVVTKAPLLVQEGDRLATADGEARIRTIDGSLVHLEAGTQITIGEQKPDMIIVRVLAGKVWAKVVKLKSRRFEVRSDAAVASVRGTEFSMAVLGPRSAVTEVQEGLVSVRALLNDRPVGAERMVGAGQSVKVLGGKIGLAETVQGMINLQGPNVEQRIAANSQLSRLGSSPAEIRATLAREVGHQLSGEALQRAAAGASASSQSEASARLQMAAIGAQTESVKPVDAKVSEAGVPVMLQSVSPTYTFSKLDDTGGVLGAPTGIATVDSDKSASTSINTSYTSYNEITSPSSPSGGSTTSKLPKMP